MTQPSKRSRTRESIFDDLFCNCGKTEQPTTTFRKYDFDTLVNEFINPGIRINLLESRHHYNIEIDLGTRLVEDTTLEVKDKSLIITNTPPNPTETKSQSSEYVTILNEINDMHSPVATRFVCLEEPVDFVNAVASKSKTKHNRITVILPKIKPKENCGKIKIN